MYTEEYILKQLIKIVNKYENNVNNKKEIPDPKEKWITIKGTHILLKDGETIADAFKRKTGMSLQKASKPKRPEYYKNQQSKNYYKILENLKESNKRNIGSEDIIAAFTANNKAFSSEAVRKKIEEAIEYNYYIEKNHAQTFQYHSDGKGHYNKERAKLHKKILNEIFINEKQAKPKNGGKPTFMVLGGRGGSGKSKFNGMVYDPKKYIVLDADAIKERLPEYKGYNAFEVHEESSDIMKKALKIAQKRGLNVVLDGTMKSFKSTQKKLQQFKEADYNIEMYYMHLPREKAAERAIGRFAGREKDFSGRFVPLNVLLDMKENEANFDRLKKYASKWAFYNNDVPEGAPPDLVDKNY
jgi:predicted ABC-type ATPase